jgi:hypothetical protein
MAERKDILESALDAGFTVIDAATIGLVKRSDEAEMCDFALKYNVTQNDLCNTALDIPLKSCSRQFTIDDIYEFDVQTIEDDETMYRAGFYSLISPSSRAIPTTASELVTDIVTTNASNYSQITGGRAVAVRPGGIQIAHTATGQIACHVFMVAAGLISGVKDVTGTELTAITQTFTSVSMTIPGVDTTTWDIYLINRIITPGTYSYSMF